MKFITSPVHSRLIPELQSIKDNLSAIMDNLTASSPNAVRHVKKPKIDRASIYSNRKD